MFNEHNRSHNHHNLGPCTCDHIPGWVDPRKKGKMTATYEVITGDPIWLIWSKEHKAWWAPDQHGYRQEATQAGLYRFDQAVTILMSANNQTSPSEMPEEMMVPKWW